MKIYYTVFILLSFLSAHSQSMEIYGGMVSNNFYDWGDTYPNDYGTYTSGENGYFGIGLRQIKIDDARIGITMQYEKYGGDIRAYSGGMGGGSSTKAKISKSILSFGLYPFDRKVFNLFNLSFGIIFSTLLEERFSGTYRVYSNFSSEFSKTEDLQEKYDSFNTSSNLGFQGSLSYDFNFSNNLILSPHYAFYFGLGQEVKNFQRDLRSIRHYLGLSLKRKI